MEEITKTEFPVLEGYLIKTEVAKSKNENKGNGDIKVKVLITEWSFEISEDKKDNVLYKWVLSDKGFWYKLHVPHLNYIKHMKSFEKMTQFLQDVREVAKNMETNDKSYHSEKLIQRLKEKGIDKKLLMNYYNELCAHAAIIFSTKKFIEKFKRTLESLNKMPMKEVTAESKPISSPKRKSESSVSLSIMNIQTEELQKSQKKRQRKSKAEELLMRHLLELPPKPNIQGIPLEDPSVLYVTMASIKEDKEGKWICNFCNEGFKKKKMEDTVDIIHHQQTDRKNLITQIDPKQIIRRNLINQLRLRSILEG
eukprot:TRINITY_DN6953_c0_g1_i1.p1 TRINITY_DN6953_c0_g1~~TRINITY_DN6953_c0_g1_i1.p1  ORF type:complete len:310 (+),score=106.58 TRINITY_DN6953_c0_g1_i1:345-1274(+)